MRIETPIFYAILFILVILAFTAECKADDTGVYFSLAIGEVNYSPGDYGGNWDSNGGLPAVIELGWRGGELSLIGDPLWHARWLHLSNLEGGVLSDIFDTNGESQVDFVGVGLCWGAC